jgi:hypothetical protein
MYPTRYEIAENPPTIKNQSTVLTVYQSLKDYSANECYQSATSLLSVAFSTRPLIAYELPNLRKLTFACPSCGLLPFQTVLSSVYELKLEAIPVSIPDDWLDWCQQLRHLVMDASMLTLTVASTVHRLSELRHVELNGDKHVTLIGEGVHNENVDAWRMLTLTPRVTRPLQVTVYVRTLAGAVWAETGG